MKKVITLKKYLFLLCLVVLLTGCSTNYNLVVDKDFKIKEDVEISIAKSNFNIKGTDIDSILTEQISSFNSKISTPVNNYKIDKGLKQISINFNNEYDSVEAYSQSKFLKNVNGKAEIYEYEDNGKKTDIFQIMVNYDFFDLVNTKNLSNYKLEELKLNIKFPYEVISTNADKVDKNTLSWDLTKLIKSRSFYIEYDKDKVYKNDSRILLIVIASILTLGIVLLIAFKKKSNNKNNI